MNTFHFNFGTDGAVIPTLPKHASSDISGSVALDCGIAPMQTLTMTGNVTVSSVAMSAGDRLTLILRQDATGGRTIAWPGSVKWSGGVPASMPTSANAKMIVALVHDGEEILAAQAGYAFS